MEKTQSHQPYSGLIDNHFIHLTEPMKQALCQLCNFSDFATRNIEVLENLLAHDDCSEKFSAENYQKIINGIPLSLNLKLFMQRLRQFRHAQLLRVVLRELTNLADTTETMQSWSACADVIIEHTLQYCMHQLAIIHGFPKADTLPLPQLFTLAMGKLGGNELNLSSDVDLIFCYSKDGYTDGKDSVPNQVFYTKVVQNFIHILQTHTQEGFVFRVDLRLRPYGDSGPLVLSIPSMETYYQEQGRDWERYAMVKARLIQKEQNIAWFQQLIVPFVYRKYVDYSVIESLRGMKKLIEREILLKPMLNDIKRGRGGIREIEFVVQCFQLIRGGRLPQIQVRNTLHTLNVLKHFNLLNHTEALKKAYLFLRKLENFLQIQNDRQTHSLPTTSETQLQLALLMGFDNWPALHNKVEQYRRIVSFSFQGVLSTGTTYETEKSILLNQLGNLWQGQLENEMAVHLLMSLHYENPENCFQMIQAFRNSPKCRRLSHASRLRLDRFIALLLVELAEKPSTDLILRNILHLLENIASRSAYVALLIENPEVLQEVLYSFANSSFISNLILNHPFLLEVLIDQKISWRPSTRAHIQEQLRRKLMHCVSLEEKEEVLRQFKLSAWLLAARAEFYGYCHAAEISLYLSQVTEILLLEVLNLAVLALAARYPQILAIQSQFAIIAYGKLGSQEMNYNSDVDLVFLYNTASNQEALVTRLSQKILHILTTRTQSGVLYAVDTRLRPSGSSGLLVSHLEAFAKYQKEQAWTWEHQALLKARILTTNLNLKNQFIALKNEVLMQQRNKEILASDIEEMRLKIRKNSIKQELVDEATSILLDIEFFVQYLLLSNPHKILFNHTNTLKQMKKLGELGILPKETLQKLSDAYMLCHEFLHRSLLA
ncbi:adenylyl transferase (plasmid) [Legionella adelaidensis]|uniref:Adenylyl transferase n=1 Tax=Legionella adelaidensis TaxID=45056 RepID=A0A0W0R586_9GAMM|nr:bifunctional [glutamate--ammonia ligase]-adenylyl-L-tyrosine phosphorylase/[glutamate--ammonia-ligase] adenylyltransferase [Legionella adelaidensis]KTC66190.1 adenylyl transferase [Legionella adelaidensis]VEH85567.1 adenylyl transferase [Legionella adelaidensis]